MGTNEQGTMLAHGKETEWNPRHNRGNKHWEHESIVPIHICTGDTCETAPVEIFISLSIISIFALCDIQLLNVPRVFLMVGELSYRVTHHVVSNLLLT